MIRYLKFAAIVAIVLCFSTSSRAQTATGVIDPSRSMNWSNAGIPGGIPNRTTICSTLTSSATSSTIDAAIQSCPSGQVVFLSAGTYTISSGISFNGKSNVTLRGAGPNSTILNVTGSDSCAGLGGDLCVIDGSHYYVGTSNVQPGGSNSHTWTAGYAQGATSITLNSVSGLSVGSVIILDQANATADNGSVFVCDVSPLCYQSGESGSSNGRTIGGVDYNQTQMVTVTGISGNTLTISPGLYMSNWSASQSPGVWWSGPVSGDGIENLTVVDKGTGSSSNIYFYDAYQSWVKNVRSENGNRNHVWLYQSSHNVIRDSYFYGTQNAAEESYGVEWFISADNLIENNIFEMIASPILSGGGTGNVSGYNYSINNYYNASPSWMQNSYASHEAGNLLNLFEGNEFNAIDCDDIHGAGGLVTIFRNQLTGSQSGKSSNTHAMNLYSHCRGYNVVGNVLGTAGYTSVYEVSISNSSGNCDLAIYDLGFGYSECGSQSNPPNDSLVESTLLRWGNYDTVNKTVRWVTSEVPSGLSQYANAVPSSQNLPISFYLSSRPAFWGAMPFPAIGPDVTGGSDSSGHVYPNPAQTCYNTTSSTGGIRNFDANTCYSLTVTAPNPPTNVKAVPQ